MIRVAVVARHPVVMAGVERVLNEGAGFSVVVRSAGVRGAIDAIIEAKPDVALVALDRSGQAGLAVARHLKGKSATRIVLLASEYAEQDVIEALQLDVRGMLLLSLDSAQIPRCLLKVAAGARWLELESSNRAIDRLLFRTSREPAPPLGLSQREYQVVRHVAAGLRTSEIASTLGVSGSTVKFHLRRVFKKLQVSNRLELLQRARAEALDLVPVE